jgi:paraquat-inducible protein B
MATASPAVVGGFILSGLALGIAAILLFGGTHLFSPTVHAVVYFRESVANLNVGAPVTFRGVRVGAVTGIAVNLDMTDFTARIPVYLDLMPSAIFLENGIAGRTDTDFIRLLKAGLRAQLNMQSLVTGQLRIDLDIQPGVAGPPVIGDGGRAEIPSIPSRLKTLEGEISELPLKEMIENARQALSAIQQVADDLPRRVGPLADSLKLTSDAARVTLNDIDRLALAGQRQLAVNGTHVERILESSDRTMRNTEALIGSLTEMVAQDSPLRGDLQAAIRDLAASAGSLRGFTRDVERDPSTLLVGRATQ